LSIRHLDPETKGRVKAAMGGLHWTRELSLNDIADLVGNKTSGYSSYLFKKLGIKPRPFKEARLKAIHEKVRKYERKPFDGTDEDKAYMLGLKHGDLYAYNPFGDAVRVSTSTTHPALANLFTDLFGQYGHVSKHPRYKKDTGTYEWNIQAILDKSFEFLLEPRDRCREWVLSKESTRLAYLAGLIDAEGHIRLHANPKTIGIEVSIWNTDTGLLEFAYKCLKQLGYMPLEPYLSQPAGGVSSGFHIARRKAEWRVLLARFEETQSLLRRLPLKHQEKVAKEEVALSIAKGDLYEKIAERLSFLKKAFHDETDRYTKQAEAEFLERHPDFRRSPPVICTLWKESWNHASEEIHEKILKSLRGCLAAHEDFLCWDDEPCVVICKGCNSRNIVSILVHESIHHALLWLADEPFEVEDPLDDIVPYLHEQGITEQGFEFYG
jgi:LAGLIDADG DNA endonuclease family protein